METLGLMCRCLACRSDLSWLLIKQLWVLGQVGWKAVVVALFSRSNKLGGT